MPKLITVAAFAAAIAMVPVMLFSASLRPALGQPQSGGSIPVTVDNFIRAESDLYLGGILKDSGVIGKFNHRREPAPIDNQTVIRLNRDTLYSSAVFDLDAGPVTITLPDAGKRFMSMQMINEDHYVPEVDYGAGAHTSDQGKGRHALCRGRRSHAGQSGRTRGRQEVHALQDAIKVNQQSAGKFEVPNWDQASQKKVRDALLVLRLDGSRFQGGFRYQGQVDPVRHLIGTAAALGRQSGQGRDLPERHACEERRHDHLQAAR